MDHGLIIVVTLIHWSRLHNFKKNPLHQYRRAVRYVYVDVFSKNCGGGMVIIPTSTGVVASLSPRHRNKVGRWFVSHVLFRRQGIFTSISPHRKRKTLADRVLYRIDRGLLLLIAVSKPLSAARTTKLPVTLT